VGRREAPGLWECSGSITSKQPVSRSPTPTSLGTDHITLTGRYRIALPERLHDKSAYRLTAAADARAELTVAREHPGRHAIGHAGRGDSLAWVAIVHILQ
jgi:hypothetical protein